MKERSQNDLPDLSFNPKIRSIIRYVAEAILATVGAVVVGELIALLAETMGQKDTPLDGPTFLGPVLVALILGCFVDFRFRHTKSSYWVWVIGLLIFVVSLLDWKESIRAGDWRPIWDNFFSRSGCGDSECLYELTATAPLYSSVTYSLAVLLCHFLRLSRR